MFRKLSLMQPRPTCELTNKAATIDYLDTGKVKTKGIVNKTFKLEEFDQALQSIKDKSAIKAAIVFE